MDDRSRSFAPAAAAAAFVLVASGYLLAGRVLHYATLGVRSAPAVTLVAAVALVAAAALLHELLVRGALYTSLKSRLPAGFAAPTVALVGAVLPVTARLLLLPRSRAPFPVVVAQAFLVEWFLGLGLTWLALGAGTWVFSGAALAVVSAVRVLVVPEFHGGVIPFLELLFALLAPLAVALVLARELRPHREALLGVS
ncbi:MAG TPA: hypothetical protein VGR00_05790 [Thermoanaerobaculia bacterium]|nr:hypothetical protein [Thermoanaerobaculia bacterium]